MKQEFLDGYLQALTDIEELTRFGAKYQQYYREKTICQAAKLRVKIFKDFENAKI